MYHIYSLYSRLNFFRITSALLVIALIILSTPVNTFAQEVQNTQDTQNSPTSTEQTLPIPGADGTTTQTASSTDGQSSSADASITTGDALATGDASTTANQNDTTTGTSSADTTNIITDNTGTASTSMDINAETGANTATAGGSATISTGNAVASANVINVINTNIVDSNGLMFFLNLLFGNIAVDLRSLFSFFSSDGMNTPATSSDCSLTHCDTAGTTLNIANGNTADIQNDITVRSGTGGNSATAGDGQALVLSGDAAASANVINVANTNIVDSSYLLISVNNFGSLAQDIILPAASFFNKIFGTHIGVGAQVSVNNQNNADVQNNVSTVADTGGNGTDTAGTGSSTITTGNGTTATNVVNEVNQNFLGDSIYILVRIHGTWSGKIFGLPDGITWRETPDGIELFGAGLANNSQEPLAGAGDKLSINNTNNASVRNNISVMALTGDNYAGSDEGSAQIRTGNANAAANVVNVVNTNVVGKNWILAIFNIFGDWAGNVSFGQPDLWLGARAQTNGGLRSGQCFDYYVTVKNNGDADASQVALDATFDPSLQTLKDENNATTTHFTVGALKAGTLRDVPVHSCLSSTIGYSNSVKTKFTASLLETDHNTKDNSDEITVTTAGISGGGSALRLGDSTLSIQKTVSRTELPAATSSIVSYTLKIKNTGDPVYKARLVDTIFDPSGKAIHQQLWDLDTIKNETITVSYDAAFNASDTPGVYTNEAFVEGYEHNPDVAHNYGTPYRSKVVRATLTILGTQEAVSPPASCDRYLTQYIQRGANNDPVTVAKLQQFLITNEHAKNITLSGNYDGPTYEAVQAFQTKYADDILTPWGIASPTGYVYYTTQHKINELYCKGVAVFGYTSDQQNEIDAFRASVKMHRERGETMPPEELQKVGLGDKGKKLASANPAIPETVEGKIEETNPITETAAVANAPALKANILSRIKTMIASIFSRF